MKKKVLFYGFGFPVILIGIPTRKEMGEEVLEANFNEIERLLFLALIRKPTRMSGAEVKFVRHVMNASQETFASVLLVDRTSISKWEAKDLEYTGMEPQTEAFLRSKMVVFSLDRGFISFKNHRMIKEHREMIELDKFLKTIVPAISTRKVGKPVSINAS